MSSVGAAAGSNHHRQASFKRALRPNLRQSTFILPRTGERVRRAFTLARIGSSTATPDDVANDVNDSDYLSPTPSHDNAGGNILKELYIAIVDAAKSPTGRGVLKCSIAYLLSSLATFVPWVSGLLGRSDGKHVVATVSVYFHPARNAGSMIEAILLAACAFLYAAFVSFTSMAVSTFFGNHNLLATGHTVVLIVFCGGGLGAIGWLKQKLGNALVNVACSLASLAIITVITREGSVQAAQFSYEKVEQVLKMVLMGVLISSVVSFTIAPRSARRELRNDLVRITDLLEEILTRITRGFLAGSEQDLNDQAFTRAQSAYKGTFNSLVKNLRESRFEHYFVGTAKQHDLEVKLVKCIERLAQSLFGLRSAAATQFQLLHKEDEEASGMIEPESDLLLSPQQTMHSGMFERSNTNGKPLDAITEVSEASTADLEQLFTSVNTPSIGRTPARTPGSIRSPRLTASASGAADIFSMFISQLGPPMKSLAFTLKGVLNELPFGPAPDYDITFNDNFIRSLEDAKDLFITARKDALKSLYHELVWARTRSPEVAADYEEVAASCGHFSSSLEDFAEDTIQYLNILQDLKDTMQLSSTKRDWNWLKFWIPRSSESRAAHEDEERLLVSENVVNARRDHSPKPWKKSRERKVAKHRDENLKSVRMWKALAPLRREDIKYAIKVGGGAVLYAMFSFIPSTRPIYTHWRGEWGLLSYMLVCSMTIGASNTTGLQRFLGTCLGAILSALAWIAAVDHPFALGFYGWLVSLWCFYIILGLGKGPMGRFILLTYNLSALYAYSLSVKDDDNDDDEGGISPEIWGIVLHRVVSVMSGCIWGIIVTRVLWPISARRKVRDGISLLWLRMGLIWKRDPLQQLVEGPSRGSYMDIREAIELQRYLNHLDGLRASATHEFDLRGPFQDKVYRGILEATGRMLGAFHAMSVVIDKDLKASPGETELLRLTRAERKQLAARISHLFSVLASSMKLEYPMNDSLPNIEHSRDRFLARLFSCRRQEDSNEIAPQNQASDEDYEVLYAYGLVTGQIATEIEGIGQSIEQLYGVLSEDNLKLR